MSLKFELETLDGLDEKVTGLYSKTESGKYRLNVEGIEDASGLKKQRDDLLNEKKEAQRKAKEAEDAARRASEEAARKAGDTEALDRSWNQKYSEALAAKESELSGLRGTLNTLLVDNVATNLANDLAVQGSAALLMPHIKSRLAVEIRDGQPKTIVTGPDGKPSALTVDELKAEFVSNPAFAPVIAGSKASGGGASGANGRGGGAVKTVTRAQLEGMSATQQAEHFRAGGIVT